MGIISIIRSDVYVLVPRPKAVAHARARNYGGIEYENENDPRLAPNDGDVSQMLSVVIKARGYCVLISTRPFRDLAPVLSWPIASGALGTRSRSRENKQLRGGRLAADRGSAACL